MGTHGRRPVEDRHADLDGIRLHYRTHGDAGGPPILLLHGLMGHAREWDTAVAALARHRQVITVDQRGHGETSWADDYTADAMAGDIVGLAERLGAGSLALVGHSMGGMVSMLVAAGHPGLVERLVIVDVGPDSLAAGLADELPGFLATMAAARYPDADAAVASWRATNPLAEDAPLRHYVEHCLVPADGGGLRWRFDAEGLTRFVIGVRPAQLWRAVEAITAPALVVRGESSDVLTAGQARQLVSRLRHGRLVEIPGGGHDLGVERPDAVAAACAEFLS